jgi:hypothetical protein
MRIVVDTNVIVSALAFGGVPREVMDIAGAGACSFYFSPAIRAEVEEVLEEKFGWSQKEIAARTRNLWSTGNEVNPKHLAAIRMLFDWLVCRHLAELTRLCSPEMTRSASRGTRFSASQASFWREANACGGPRCFPGASGSSAPSVHAPGVDEESDSEWVVHLFPGREQQPDLSPDRLGGAE